MSKEAVIIADIAGQFDALMRLVSRFPADTQFVLVGDLIDRGPYSVEVVEWAMKSPNVVTVMGNHEHMMLDYWRRGGVYQSGLWEWNGGTATMLSYDRAYGDTKPPESHLEWLEKLPLHHWIGEKCLVTHAALSSGLTLDEACTTDDLEDSVLWNRGAPVRADFLQVFGHNSHWGLMPFADEETGEVWAICLDQSRKELVTGFHYPSGEIFEEPYLVGATRGLEVQP